MSTNIHKTAQLGDLVVAAFDAAARLSSDSSEVSRIATRAVTQILGRSRKVSPAPRRLPPLVGGHS